METSAFLIKQIRYEAKRYKEQPKQPKGNKRRSFREAKKSISEFPKMLTLRPLVINSENVVLGGNMRLKALKELGYKDIPDEWVKRADELTEDEQKRFIIADNVGFGEHDWEALANEWNVEELSDWGLDCGGFEVDPNECSDSFNLKDGDKAPFQANDISRLATNRQEANKKRYCGHKGQTEEYKYAETMGNEKNQTATHFI